MRSIKTLLLAVLVCFLIIPAWGLDVSMADLFQYSPDGSPYRTVNITEDLFKGLRKQDKTGILSLSRVRSTHSPKSILDAARLSEKGNKAYLLYGFLKVTSGYYDFEVKLYDRKAGRIQKVFYAKDSIDGYETLIDAMSDRIIGYFNKILGVTRRKREAEKEYEVFDVETIVGYWIPFDPWSQFLTGLASVSVSGGFTPVEPLFTRDIFAFSLRYGISLNYSPGMNREGYESFFLHTLRFGFPVRISAIWHERNKVMLQVSPELQVDILVQDRLYTDTVVEKSTAFSLSGALGYEYLFSGKRVSLGAALAFHTAFYTAVLFSLEPSLYVKYRFKGNKK